MKKLKVSVETGQVQSANTGTQQPDRASHRCGYQCALRRGAVFSAWLSSIADNCGLYLFALVSGCPLLTKHCAVGMIASAAGIGLALLLSAR